MVAEMQDNRDGYAVFDLSRVNDYIIEAPRRVLEPAGNFIQITI